MFRQTNIFNCIFWLKLLAIATTSCDSSLNQPVNEAPPPFCGEMIAEQTKCLRPWLPYLNELPLGESLSFPHPHGASTRVGVSFNPKATQPEQWEEGIEITFTQRGVLKIFIEVDAYRLNEEDIECPSINAQHIYQVVSAYDPIPEKEGSAAIGMDDSRFIAWGEEIFDNHFGAEVSPMFQQLGNALGPAQGTPLNVVSLGQGGDLTYFFETPIANGPGPDFALFENSFSDLFLELARVEVSTDGDVFVPYPHSYLGESTISSFGEHDPTLIYGLAGKYRAGFGTPFDLSTLAWTIEAQKGLIDLHAIHFVKIIDIIGNGEERDTFHHPIYDPYPTQESAGFDLDGIGVLNTAEFAPCPL